jgi:hypothetical protein
VDNLRCRERNLRLKIAHDTEHDAHICPYVLVKHTGHWKMPIRCGKFANDKVDDIPFTAT